MEESNTAPRNALEFCRGIRRYEAGDTRLNKRAYMLLEMRQSVPGEKLFRVLERSGSRIIQSRVIEPIINAERVNAGGNARAKVDICRRNYTFTFVGRDAPSDSYVFAAEPIKPSKYLFRGRVWVDAVDFAIRRIEGEPAQSPSFWVRHTHFIHEYARFGDFWFPIINITEAELRLFGRSQLRIEYSAYEWQSATVIAEKAPGR